jgi:hypothetical protein
MKLRTLAMLTVLVLVLPAAALAAPTIKPGNDNGGRAPGGA